MTKQMHEMTRKELLAYRHELKANTSKRGRLKRKTLLAVCDIWIKRRKK